LATFNI